MTPFEEALTRNPWSEKVVRKAGFPHVVASLLVFSAILQVLS